MQLYRFLPYLFLLFALQSCLLARIDRTPYQQTDSYAKMTSRINAVTQDNTYEASDTVKAGWSKINSTPSRRISMAGYGNRFGRKYTSVHDSTFIKVFVFENKWQKTAMIFSDLLIFPPTVVKQLDKDLPSIGWATKQLYLTATHTHSSSGGWARKLVGKLIAGRYRKEEVKRLSQLIAQGITQASGHTAPAQVGFAKYGAGELVNNRLIGEEGSCDTSLYVVKLAKTTGEIALITSFSAHATCLSSKDYALSRDYPGLFTDLLEKDGNVSLAAFCAGGVGSHAPTVAGDTYYQQMEYMATRLANKVIPNLSSIPLQYEYQLRNVSVPLEVRKPQWKLSKNVRFRPWVFYWLYGKYPASLTSLQIGPLLWLGAPCDFSGELTAALRPTAAAQNLQLLVTSFNGGYIGYITKDEHYDRKHFETRAMNWFGPYNGAYLTEMLNNLIRKF